MFFFKDLFDQNFEILKFLYSFIYLLSLNRVTFFLNVLIITLISAFLISRDFTKILDINLYSQEFISFQSGQTIFESRLFWKGEYLFLIMMLSLKFLNVKVFFFIYHFVSLYILSLAIKKIFVYFFKIKNFYFSPFILLSYGFLLLYAYVIRQGMAFSFALLCISLYLSNKNKRAFVSSIISIGFHTSAFIMFIPILFNILIKTSILNKIFLICLSILFLYLFDLNDYYVVKFESFENESNNLILVKLLISILPFILYSITGLGKEYIKFFLILYLILGFFMTNPKLLSRVLLYTELISFLYFNFIFMKIKSNQIFLKYTLLFLVSFPMLLILLNTNSISGLFVF